MKEPELGCSAFMLIRDGESRGRVLKALADEYSQAILLSTVEKAVSAVELSTKFNIPISTAYRRIHELEEVGLIAVERSVITDDGKRYDLYRSTVKGVKVIFGTGSVVVELEPNEDMVRKFMRIWSYMRG